MSETIVILARGCTCGECDEACQYRMYKPCCGACMATAAFDLCPACDFDPIAPHNGKGLCTPTIQEVDRHAH